MKKQFVAWLMLLVAGLAAAGLVQAAGRGDIAIGKRLAGKVTEVTDAGVLEMHVAGMGVVSVRLASLGLPVPGSSQGRAAQALLRSTCADKPAEAVVVGEDMGGRPIAQVSCNGTSAELALVEKGYAWIVLPGTVDAVLREAESEAKAKKLGVWSTQ